MRGRYRMQRCDAHENFRQLQTPLADPRFWPMSPPRGRFWPLMAEIEPSKSFSLLWDFDNLLHSPIPNPSGKSGPTGPETRLPDSGQNPIPSSEITIRLNPSKPQALQAMQESITNKDVAGTDPVAIRLLEESRLVIVQADACARSKRAAASASEPGEEAGAAERVKARADEDSWTEDRESARWFYLQDNEKMGPVTLREIGCIMSDPSIKFPLRLVWTEGMSGWRSVYEVRVLCEAVAEAESAAKAEAAALAKAREDLRCTQARQAQAAAAEQARIQDEEAARLLALGEAAAAEEARLRAVAAVKSAQESRALAIATAQAKAEQNARAEAEAEARLKAAEEARARAEAHAAEEAGLRAAAEAKAAEEAMTAAAARAQAMAVEADRARTEAAAIFNAKAAAKASEVAIAAAEARTAEEAKLRKAAEATAAKEAKLREVAEAKMARAAKLRAATEAKAIEIAQAAAAAKTKSEDAARAISSRETERREAAETNARKEAGLRAAAEANAAKQARLRALAEARLRSEEKARTKAEVAAEAARNAGLRTEKERDRNKAQAAKTTHPTSTRRKSAHDAWFYTCEGERLGPVTFNELRSLAANSSLNPRLDMAWRKTMAAWLPAGQIAGLFERSSLPVEPAAPPQPAALFPSPQANAPGSMAGFDYWPGARRRSLVLIALVFPIAWHYALNGISPLATKQFGDALMGRVLPAAAYLPLVVFLWFGLKRLANLNMSRLWCFAVFAPVFNLWIGYRCFACPPGYAFHKKMDRPGIAMAIFYWLVVLLGILGVVIFAIDRPGIQLEVAGFISN